MIFAIAVTVLVLLIASFVAGAQYGRSAEQAVKNEFIALRQSVNKELTDAELKASAAFKKL